MRKLTYKEIFSQRPSLKDLEKQYPKADIIYIAFMGFVDPSDKLSLADFGKDEFIRILKNYQQRERRFGKVES